MNKRYLILSVVLIVLLAGACGGGEATQPTQQAAPQPQPTAVPPTAPPEAPPTAPPEAGRSDIPQMADATEVATTETEGSISITYKSASALDAVITFYQSEMATQGWTYQAEVSSIVSGVNAVLYFTKAGEEAAVSLTSVGGVTMVVIAIQAGGTAQPPAPEPTAPTGGEAGQPDIPVMADATGLTTALSGDETAITYNSASAMDDIITFYETEMPLRGWSYDDSSIVSGVSAVLYFTQGDAEATVTLTSMAGATVVVIAVEGEITAQPPVEPTAPSGGEPGQPDIPVTADASGLTTVVSGDETAITYNSASAMDDIIAFYETEMPPRGWSYDDSSIVSGVSAVLYFSQGDAEAIVTLTSMGGTTVVAIAVVGEVTVQPTAPPAGEPTAAPPEPTAPPAGEPTAAPPEPTAPPAEPTAAGPCERGSGANYVGAQLVQPNFQGQDLQCADFSSSELFQPNFINANLFRAIFDGAEVEQGNFSGAYLGEVRFDLGEYHGPNFSGANLSWATFINVQMTDPNFSNANLNGANFSGLVMTGAIWNNTICPDGQNSNDVGGSCEGHY